MTTYVCSLINTQGQDIEPGDYQVVRFPYGSSESYDAHEMHQAAQPDGTVSVYPDERSGLIWPQHDAWGYLHALLYWEGGTYNEVRDRFVRDPLDLTTGYDSTCTEDHAKTPGGQYIAKSWAMFVHPETPIGLLVRHSVSTTQRLALAEFKLSYTL